MTAVLSPHNTHTVSNVGRTHSHHNLLNHVGVSRHTAAPAKKTVGNSRPVFDFGWTTLHYSFGVDIVALHLFYFAEREQINLR